VLCLWSAQSEFMTLFMVFSVWIGPGFVFDCYSVTYKCTRFVRITVILCMQHNDGFSASESMLLYM
jgi:hypothetical protein